MLGVRRWDRVTGLFSFFFRFPGRNLLGEGGVTTPSALRTLPAVPILAIWREQAVDLQPL